MIDIIGKIPIWNTFQLMHNGLRAFNQNVPFLFPGSEVSGRPLPKGENALHRTLQEKRDQFQAKIYLHLFFHFHSIFVSELQDFDL